MKARGAAVQGVLAVGALVAAYVTWQRPAEATRGDVVALDIGKNALEKVRFQDGDKWIELTRGKGGDEPAIWVRQGIDPQPAGADGAAEAGVPAPPPRDLRGSDRAEKTFDLFAPLRAVRDLGVLPKEKLGELGLEGSGRKLEVTARGVPRAYTVSAPSPGVGSPYIREEGTGRVYLMPTTTLADLNPTSTMPIDRRLHAFKQSEFDALTVQADGASKEYVQTGAASPQTAKLAPKAAPDKPDDFARNWHDKLWNRLMVIELLGKGEAPKGGEPKVVLRVEYASQGKPKGWLEVAKGEGKDALARSEHTVGWVVLHGGADEVLEEGRRVAGAK